MINWLSPTLANRLSLSQLILTMLGFAIAIWQIIRTANATSESKKLLGKVQNRLVENELLIELTELNKLRESVQTNVGAMAKEKLLDDLDNYVHSCSTILELIVDYKDSGTEQFREVLKKGIISASQSKSAFSSSKSANLTKVMKTPQEVFLEISSETSRMIVRVKNKGGSK